MKILLTSLFVLAFAVTQAQDKKEAVVEVQTSAVCEMCKATLEKEMAFEKGVKESNLDLETMILKVTYNPKKTDPETIRKRITKTGYDADSLSADVEAYNNLNPCCKKGAHDDDHR